MMGWALEAGSIIRRLDPPPIRDRWLLTPLENAMFEIDLRAAEPAKEEARAGKEPRQPWRRPELKTLKVTETKFSGYTGNDGIPNSTGYTAS